MHQNNKAYQYGGKENHYNAQAVDAITKSAKGSDLDEDFVKKMKLALDVISEKLGTTDTQSLMMVRFINHAFDKNIEINDVFDDTDCPTSRKLELMNDVEWLVDNRYLMRIKDHWGEKSYKIPDNVLSSSSTTRSSSIRNMRRSRQGLCSLSLRSYLNLATTRKYHLPIS